MNPKLAEKCKKCQSLGCSRNPNRGQIIKDRKRIREMSKRRSRADKAMTDIRVRLEKENVPDYVRTDIGEIIDWYWGEKVESSS